MPWAVLVIALLALPLACTPATMAEAPDEQRPTDWNQAAIAWRDYAAGFSEAQSTGRPAILIFYTDWCPHCHNYSRLFHDPRVVELARRFVMIRVERDGNPELSARHVPDGDYVPRTLFFDASGAFRADLTSDNPEYRYFLDEHDPLELLALMERAAGARGAR